MKVAVPLTKELMLYSDNPYTAAKFAIYLIVGDKTDVSYSLVEIVDNPRYIEVSDRVEEIERECACDLERQNDIQHICEHYSILESIGSCSYLLAARYCKNTIKSLQNGGIKIFQIPTIIKKADIAIKNFLIGASFANKIQNIHHAS